MRVPDTSRGSNYCSARKEYGIIGREERQREWKYQRYRNVFIRDNRGSDFGATRVEVSERSLNSEKQKERVYYVEIPRERNTSHGIIDREDRHREWKYQ